METTVAAATIAGLVSLVGFVVTTLWNRHALLEQLRTEQEKWQESYRAELHRDLTRETNLRIMEQRMISYGGVWEMLRITSKYEARNAIDIQLEIRTLANQLTSVAYGTPGMLMSDRTRRLLNHLRQGCAAYLKSELDLSELQTRAHLLKHSMRSDLGIEDYEYSNEVRRIALSLGRVDDWSDLTGDLEVLDDTAG